MDSQVKEPRGGFLSASPPCPNTRGHTVWRFGPSSAQVRVRIQCVLCARAHSGREVAQESPVPNVVLVFVTLVLSVPQCLRCSR